MNKDKIYEALRADILSGELPPDTPLREVALASRFSVSRTPVREALTRLEEAGLAYRAQRSLRVRGVDPSSIMQVYELRILLEEEACGQAALRRTMNDLLVLEALIERDRALIDAPDTVLIKNNLEFHEATWHATQNAVLIDVLGQLCTHLIHAPSSTLSYPGRWETALHQHAEILRAITDRDEQRARAVARQHFTDARNIRLETLRQATLAKTLED